MLPFLVVALRENKGNPGLYLLQTQSSFGFMYGMYASIWSILMVNVTIYSIHGSNDLYS